MGKRRETANTSQPSQFAQRVDRARKRATALQRPLMGKQRTHFGVVTLTDRRRGKGGFTTTNARDHRGATAASRTDGSYKALLSAAEPETLAAVVIASRAETRKKGRIKPVVPKLADPDQQRVAAHLIGIGRSEQQRDPAAHKGFRSGIRAARAAAVSGKGADERASALFRAFPQAAPQKAAVAFGFATGAKALLPPVKGGVSGRRAAKARDMAGAEYSDSSDDDE